MRGADGSNSKFVINSNINVLKLEPIYLVSKEAWFKLGDYLLCLKFVKNDTVELAILSETVRDIYSIRLPVDCNHYSILIEDTNICNEISQIIENYPRLVNEYELVEKARAIRLLGYTTVPKLPGEWELIIYSITNKILTSKVIKTFYIVDSNRTIVLGIYCYDKGYYYECEDMLKKEIHTILSSSRLLDIRLTPQLTGIIIRNIEIRTLEPYTPARRKLLFKNKVFDWDIFVETGDIELSLIDPSPDLIITHRIPWELKPGIFKNVREGLLKYIPPHNTGDFIELFKALAPKSFRAFMDWVKKPGESDESAYPRIVLLLEIIGYTLYPHEYPLNKAVLLVGSGANGKSTYLRLIETILSKSNVSSVNLSDLDIRFNRFAPADLYNKLANISSEPIKRHFDPTLFKMLTGEDLVRVERKFRDSFTYHNYAKMIFSANELPEITEDTYAFWRRWIVIEFPNRFAPDHEFFDRTFTHDEIEVLILLSLYAFRQVLLRKSFTEIGVDIKEEWMVRSNPIYLVVKRMLEDNIIELDPAGYIVKRDLYALYQIYVSKLQGEGYDIDALAQKDFTIRLSRYFQIRTREKRIGGKLKHVYSGVKIKDYSKARELVPDLETPEVLV